MVNKVILIGNVGKDPEIRTLESGVKVARISLATTEKMYNGTTKETTDHTEWHILTLWRGLADVVDRYVRKGSQIYVEGKLRTREWTDPTTNVKRYSTEILVDEMKMLGRKADGASTGGTYAGGGNMGGGNSVVTPVADTAVYDAPAAGSDVDDLPF